MGIKIEIKTVFEFIKFEEIPSIKLKTKRWACRNNKSEKLIGTVKWYGAWRQYCYIPCNASIYSAGCLSDIEGFLNSVNEDYKLKRLEEKGIRIRGATK